MPEKPTTVAAYAAGASLAAIAIFYVFGPNYTIDGDDGNRKKNIVGLSNPANDCFINSVLQALAGLGGLRIYLIRELHRRELDGPDVYNALPNPEDMPKGVKEERVMELQQGTITRALKEMLDQLNERPIYKKTISARGFIQALEYAYRTRISRSQQDAQEFLQIVTERLSDEYHAGVRARQRAQGLVESPLNARTLEADKQSDDRSEQLHDKGNTEMSVRVQDGSEEGLPVIIDNKLKEIDHEYGFPFQGEMESQIECQSCQYQYKPNKTSFVNLTLQVPQKSSTTLSSCFDGLLKTEYIDDFRCDRCCLQHALDAKLSQKTRATSEEDLKRLEVEIERIRDALQTDPEQMLEGIDLAPAEIAPKRRIARHMRITVFPKIIAIHLSRSIFDKSSSTKNAAKVAFPERLALGGILNQKWFKLLAIVCHKGSHNSGHYESFRRNNLYPPFSTPDVFSSYAQSRVESENPSEAPSPRILPRKNADVETASASTSTVASSASLAGDSPPSSTGTPTRSTSQVHPPLPSSPRPTTSSSRVSLRNSRSRASLAKQPLPSTTDSQNPGAQPRSSPALAAERARSQTSPQIGPHASAATRLRRKRKANDRWWRISDEKVKECKTSDVLGMQKEVYLLFYELDTTPPTEL